MKFGTFGILNMQISILMSKIIFIKYLPHQVFTALSIDPNIKSAQDLLKFGTLDISNMSILILMSKSLMTMV